MYRIKDKEFRTKQQLTEFIQAKLHGYDLGETVTNDDFEFLMALLQHHPHKGSEDDGWFEGIVGIKVDSAKYSTRCFHVLYLDGKSSDFSFLNLDYSQRGLFSRPVLM